MLGRQEQRAFEAFVASASGRLVGIAYLLCGGGLNRPGFLGGS
jgi:hypothetical protein